MNKVKLILVDILLRYQFNFLETKRRNPLLIPSFSLGKT